MRNFDMIQLAVEWEPAKPAKQPWPPPEGAVHIKKIRAAGSTNFRRGRGFPRLKAGAKALSPASRAAFLAA